MSFDYVRDGRILCPTCEIGDFDVLSASSTFPAVRCKLCGLGIERRLALSVDAYEAANYGESRDNNAGVRSSLRWHHDVAVATMRYNQLAELIGPHPSGRNEWIDVGCGAGAMLTVAQRHGYETIGIEDDPLTVTAPSAVRGFHTWITRSYSDKLWGAVITAYDVIEHMPDPTAAIRAIDRDALDGAIVVFEVPDLDRCDNFDKWTHRRINESFTEHIWHFSTTSLDRMIRRYAPRLQPVWNKQPVPGKLQSVWRSTRSKAK